MEIRKIFSKIFDLMIDHPYCTFYNKISGTRLSQWISTHLLHYCQLIFDASSSGSIKETETANDEVIKHTIIQCHFEFDSSHAFGFLDYFASPNARLGDLATRQ
jgi:hypothetical protein